MNTTEPFQSFNHSLPECHYYYRHDVGARVRLGEAWGNKPNVVTKDITRLSAHLQHHFATSRMLMRGHTSDDIQQQELLFPYDFDDTLEHILGIATNGMPQAQQKGAHLTLRIGRASKSVRHPRYQVSVSLSGLPEAEETESPVSVDGRERLAARSLDFYISRRSAWFNASGIDLLVLGYSLENAQNRYPDVERAFISMGQTEQGRRTMTHIANHISPLAS